MPKCRNEFCPFHEITGFQRLYCKNCQVFGTFPRSFAEKCQGSKSAEEILPILIAKLNPATGVLIDEDDAVMLGMLQKRGLVVGLHIYPRLQMNPVTAKIGATERAAEMCFRTSNSNKLYHTFLNKHLDLFKS